MTGIGGHVDDSTFRIAVDGDVGVTLDTLDLVRGEITCHVDVGLFH